MKQVRINPIRGSSKKFVAGNGHANARIRARASWTAVAERSGDTAFARAMRYRANQNLCPHESGVALRFPPQSKTSRNLPPMFYLNRFDIINIKPCRRMVEG